MNPRVGFSTADPEVEDVVEVPAVGTVLVEEGEQYAVEDMRTKWTVCYCEDGTHPEWPAGRAMFSRDDVADARRMAARSSAAHVVAIHTYTVVGEVRG